MVSIFSRARFKRPARRRQHNENSTVRAAMCAGTCWCDSDWSCTRIVGHNRAPKTGTWVPGKGVSVCWENSGYKVIYMEHRRCCSKYISKTTIKASSSVQWQINRNQPRFSPDFCSTSIAFFYIWSDHYSAQWKVLIHERRQQNTNNSKNWPGTSKSVAMCITYDWFFCHKDQLIRPHHFQ